MYFVNAGLFSGITNFKELETRISNLTKQDRGDAFEVFAEAYFNTQKAHQAAAVWSFNNIPQHIRSELGLGGRDMGVDGVIKTNDGRFAAYQVKFRSNRKSVTWAEGSTFVGYGEYADERILFSNFSELDSTLADRKNFYAIMGYDLDRLEARDFEAIEQWLKDNPKLDAKAVPLQHQVEALNAIKRALAEHDRVTVVMACGTGKTLLSLWLAEQYSAQSILVLLPSLSLIRQTLHNWAKETTWNDFSFLCICSDQTVVNNDEIIVKKTDCDFPVTTDADAVKKFLSSSHSSRKIIFSTYQSCKFIPQDFVFDLAIFDEAHKTAGREGTNFAYALKDQNTAIKKRVFLTATPRHFDIGKKDKEGDLRLVYSMDDHAIYGPICHRLSFSEAAKREIICNYKVIISVVTSDLLTKELLRHSEVNVQGDHVKALRVANILALKSAIERYNIKRVFTFHNSVKAAQSFTSESSEGVVSFLKDFNTFHVNGQMPTSKRERIMSDFRNASQAIMSNARCLTEGVDVPAVDMVAFISPKKSQVDIVQAAGRAMRRAPDKEYGYILIPVFLEVAQGETIEQALEKTQYDEIWQVLQALQEHDESLAEIIGQMRQDIGRTGSCSESCLREKVEVLAPEVSLITLRNAITTRIVDRLGSTWDEHFGELVKFKEEHRHCNVPANYPINPALGIWVSNQRQNNKNHRKKYKNRLLAQKFIERLNAIGFDWDPLSNAWERMFEVLFIYWQKNRNCNVPQFYPENPSLGIWVGEQRKSYNKKQLDEEYINRLNEIGFDWNPVAILWEKMYASLHNYYLEKGNSNVPQAYPANPALANWVGKQRQSYRKSQLVQDYIDRLNAVDFDWNPRVTSWENQYTALCDYRKEHGNCNVPQSYVKNLPLSKWVCRMRLHYNKGKLAQSYIDRLNDIDFDWAPFVTTWENMFTALYNYWQINGHCNVPQRYPNDPSLGQWVENQRQKHKKKKLAQNYFERLDALGFNWDPLNEAWESNFVALCKFHKENGHCDVPNRYPENPALGEWVNGQRQKYKKKQLDQKCVDRLNGLNFIWDRKVFRRNL